MGEAKNLKWDNLQLKSNHVCTGCALLCDDVWIGINPKTQTVDHTYHACIRGHRHLLRMSMKKRAKQPIVRKNANRTKVTWEKAIQESKNALKASNRVLIYGVGSTSNEVQKRLFEITQDSSITLIGNTEHTYRPVLEFLQSKWKNKMLSFDRIRDEAEHLIFWGSNPAETQPRYMSRYTVFPRGKKTPNGRESRILSTFDIRFTPTSQISNHHFTVTPESDARYLLTLADSIGKNPKDLDLGGIEKDQGDSFRSLTKSLQQSQLALICVGGGLFSPTYSVDNLEALNSLCVALEEKGLTWGIHVMVGQPNAMGYIKYAQPKKQFAANDYFDSQGSHAPDTILVLGGDPLAKLPNALHEVFHSKTTIVFEPEASQTAENANIHFPIDPVGITASGTMRRLDDKKIELTPQDSIRLNGYSDISLLDSLF